MTGFQKLGGALELCSGESQRPDEAHNGLTGRLIVVDNRNQQVRRHPHAFHCLGCWLRCGLPVALTQESPALRKGWEIRLVGTIILWLRPPKALCYRRPTCRRTARGRVTNRKKVVEGMGGVGSV